MKKVIFALGLSFISAVSFAQSGNNQIGVGADVAIPTGDLGDLSSIGIGGSIKGLYGIGSAGQITLSAGFLSFATKSEYEDLLGADKITSTMIPILAGYRHNFNGFYAEPQIGYGIYGAKIKGGMFDGSDSEGAFTWAVGAGYVFNNLDFSARYQSATKDGTSQSFFGIRVGYLFSLSGK